jgi:hypothetical protein
MKVAILANDAASFIKPVADGLVRMFKQIGVNAHLFTDGLRQLDYNPNTRSPIKKVANVVYSVAVHNRFMRGLKSFDAIIVIETIPQSFMRARYTGIERLRQRYPNKPILLYQQMYLGTRGKWWEWLRDGTNSYPGLKGGDFGLERYDWYLASSLVSEYPMPKGDNPVTLIGANLDDGTLYPDQQGKFVALLDYEHPAHKAEREIQLRALNETGTEHFVLSDYRRRPDILKIYRQSSIYFVAHREIFGLSIVELQACGAYIFTPYARWTPSHWIKDLHEVGEGKLTRNFYVYNNNDLDTLKAQIAHAKTNYDSARIRETLLTTQPHFYYGVPDALRDVVAKIERGEINGQLHKEHMTINARIITELEDAP